MPNTIDIHGRKRILHNGLEICNNFNSSPVSVTVTAAHPNTCLTCKSKAHSSLTCPIKSSQTKSSNSSLSGDERNNKKWLVNTEKSLCSTINMDQLSQELSQHEDPMFLSYLINWFIFGFDAKNQKTNLEIWECRNLQSTLQNKEAVDELFSQRENQRIYFGTFTKLLSEVTKFYQ